MRPFQKVSLNKLVSVFHNLGVSIPGFETSFDGRGAKAPEGPNRCAIRAGRLLRFLHLIPQAVELLGRQFLNPVACAPSAVLYRFPPCAELRRTGTQRALGIDALFARNVHEGEQHVAELELSRGGADRLMLVLGALLGNLIPHICDAFPLKANGSSLA